MKRNTEHLKQKIREILDFPTPGIKFKDITPLLEDPESFKEAIDGLVDFFRDIKINQTVYRLLKGFRVFKQRSNVLKLDSRRREIQNFPDFLFLMLRVPFH